MKVFGDLSVYLGIGFLLSYIINQANLYLFVAIALIIVGIAINVIIPRRNKKQ